MKFESGKSVKAVTTKVKVDQSGNMTLIDTPGTNDPDKKRTDSQIQLELMNTIRALLRETTEGINTFTQCILPDAAGRIKRSAIQSMCTMLLSLTSLYEDADMKNQPRLCVIFNNVSKNAHPEKVVPEYGKGATSAIDPKKEEKQ